MDGEIWVEEDEHGDYEPHQLTELQTAVRIGDADEVRRLLLDPNHRKDLNQLDSESHRSPLMDAVNLQNEGVVKALLDGGACVGLDEAARDVFGECYFVVSVITKIQLAVCKLGINSPPC